MSKHEKNYGEPARSGQTGATEQVEFLVVQSEVDENVRSEQAAEPSIATVTQGPRQNDRQSLLSLHNSLDGPQYLIRSVGYSRPDYPHIPDSRMDS